MEEYKEPVKIKDLELFLDLVAVSVPKNRNLVEVCNPLAKDLVLEDMDQKSIDPLGKVREPVNNLDLVAALVPKDRNPVEVLYLLAKDPVDLVNLNPQLQSKDTVEVLDLKDLNPIQEVNNLREVWYLVAVLVLTNQDQEVAPYAAVVDPVET